MIMVIALGTVAVFVATAVGDATTAALASGAFTLLNTTLLVLLRRDHRDVRRALTSDRRIIYDADGRPVGTALELREGDGWARWRSQASRRHDDTPTTERHHDG